SKKSNIFDKQDNLLNRSFRQMKMTGQYTPF
ncbi:MAG: hypothetical protein RLZ33_2404, partial [Bacteroidota bacterium]